MSTPTLKQPAFSWRKVKFISGLKKKSIFKESWEETEVVVIKPPEGLTFLSLKMKFAFEMQRQFAFL